MQPQAPQSIVLADPIADGAQSGRIEDLRTSVRPCLDDVLFRESPAVAESGGDDGNLWPDRADKQVARRRAAAMVRDQNDIGRR